MRKIETDIISLIKRIIRYQTSLYYLSIEGLLAEIAQQGDLSLEDIAALSG